MSGGIFVISGGCGRAAGDAGSPMRPGSTGILWNTTLGGE